MLKFLKYIIFFFLSFYFSEGLMASYTISKADYIWNTSIYPTEYQIFNFSITETGLGAAGNKGFSKGQTDNGIIIDLPDGFEFKTTGYIATVTATGTEVTINSLTFVSATRIKVKITTASTNIEYNVLNFNNFEIRAATSGASGIIYRSGGTLKVDNSTTLPASSESFGNLSAHEPMPIELLSFNAIYDDGDVLLNWATASETNNDYFTIERSIDANFFEPIIIIKGAGNSNKKIDYSTIDNNPPLGTIYYRLKQTDFDGSYKNSDIVGVKTNKDVEKMQVDQPFFDGSKLKVVIKNISPKLFVEIIDIKGSVCFFEIYNMLGQNMELNIDVGIIPIGSIYFLKIYSEKEIVVKKFVY